MKLIILFSFYKYVYNILDLLGLSGVALARSRLMYVKREGITFIFNENETSLKYY